MKIFFLYYEVRPTPGSDNFDSLGGAFVSCWIEAIDQNGAERVATEELTQRGFEAVSLLEARVVMPTDERSEPGWERHLGEARDSGESYLYNAWPPGPQEDDSIH